jgi:hypothetical protein
MAIFFQAKAVSYEDAFPHLIFEFPLFNFQSRVLGRIFLFKNYILHRNKDLNKLIKEGLL